MYSDDKTYQPPAGWHEFCGKLERVETVGGWLARHDEARFVCRRHSCRRQGYVDLVELGRQGFKDILVSQAFDLLRCHSIGGCGLAMEIRRGSTVALHRLTKRPHVKVRFFCRSCRYQRTATIERVMARAKLRTAETGKPFDDVDQLRELPLGPCPTCKKTWWDIHVLWPNTNSAGFRAMSSGD